MTAAPEIIRALGSIGTATLLSRVLGYVRDMVVALAFGAGPVTDAFFVAFRIPNILRRLLAEGALATAVIPVFSDYLANRTRAELARMLAVVFGAALVVLSAVAALGIVTAPWIVRAIAPGFAADASQWQLATLLTRLMFPYLLLVGLGALAMGALQAHGRFFAAALGPAVLNIGMIVGVTLLRTRLDPPIVALAIGVLVGGLGQILVQVPGLRREGLLVAPALEPRHPVLRRVVRLLLPSVLGLAAVQVSVFVNTLLASLLEPGSISYLYYADRVMEFPLGVFGIALASAALPAMARQGATGDTRAIADTLAFALRLSFFIAAPATVGLILLRTPITRLLFERGQFGPAETAATATALAWYAAGLAGFSGARIAAQAFYALSEPGTAVRWGTVSIGAGIVAAVALMGPLGHAGLAAASSVGAYVNVLTLIAAARRRLGRLGGRAMVASAARTLVACVPVAVWCVALRAVAPPPPTLRGDLGVVALGVVVGALIFWIASALLRAPERAALAAILPRRRRA
ncbi:MAG: murein biosynthesis integral membrane protein MurJ [Candidatus Rokubacteria bacterium]|nr:murein biosynthesis integral membrane protein MurJ [Candidatus Rokubacteria bacterium]